MLLINAICVQLLVVPTAAHVLRDGSTKLNSPRDISGPPTLVFKRHPLLGGIPIPRSSEAVHAASKRDYIHWAAKLSEKRGQIQPRFATAEHAYLGDSLVLQGPDGSNLPPLYNFTLPNGLTLTYGEINCLAGDFYGTISPISDGANLTEQISRFRAAFSQLANDKGRQPSEARQILAIAKDERDTFAAAVAKGADPSVAYSTLEDMSLAYETITVTRPSGQPSYLRLAATNYDHFGADARTAYNAGHYAALQVAAAGNLLAAYTLNAFADHYLQDSFAAGHLRTPRRYLHSTSLGGPADYCAKLMHDEDNAIGLTVTNPRGATWVSHGDNYLMDKSDRDNVAHAHNALQISVGEILAAYKSRVVPAISTFGAWAEAPTLASAASTTQRLAPLFTADGKRRNDVGNRHTWSFTGFYTYAGTILSTTLSGLWKYPIVMT